MFMNITFLQSPSYRCQLFHSLNSVRDDSFSDIEGTSLINILYILRLVPSYVQGEDGDEVFALDNEEAPRGSFKNEWDSSGL